MKFTLNNTQFHLVHAIKFYSFGTIFLQNHTNKTALYKFPRGQSYDMNHYWAKNTNFWALGNPKKKPKIYMEN